MRDPYLIDAVVRALEVLELFSDQAEIRLTDVTQRLGLIKSTAFRLLYTLEKQQYLERGADGKTYRRKRRHKLGLVSIPKSIPFVAEVERGIEKAAREAGMQLLVRHNNFDGVKAVEGTEALLAEGVSVLLCYNPDEHASHVIADRCQQARVPLVAITFPVAGARLFGINNYRAGLSGGEDLGEEVARRWGKLDNVLILDIPGSSPAQKARVTGMLEGLRKHVPVLPAHVEHLHTIRQEGSAETVMAGFLGRHPRARRIAVLCYNDVNALGALRAVERAKRSGQVMILSQGGVAEVRRELRKPSSALWGAVAHFPERFGEHLIPVVRKILRGEPLPMTTFSDHVLLTHRNVDRFYRD
jgi:ribose transport system substrate-binding protein